MRWRRGAGAGLLAVAVLCRTARSTGPFISCCYPHAHAIIPPATIAHNPNLGWPGPMHAPQQQQPGGVAPFADAPTALLMQSLTRQVHLQQPHPVPAGVQQVLPYDFVLEQGLSYAAPFAGVMPSVISHTPVYDHYQPHIGHVLGGAASGQRLLRTQMLLQQQQGQGPQLGGLTYPTGAVGSFSYGMPGGPFIPQGSLFAGQSLARGAAAGGAGCTSGEGQPPPQQQQQKKKGGGSRQDMSGEARVLPTLSFIASQGGFIKVGDHSTRSELVLPLELLVFGQTRCCLGRHLPAHVPASPPTLALLLCTTHMRMRPYFRQPSAPQVWSLWAEEKDSEGLTWAEKVRNKECVPHTVSARTCASVCFQV